MFFQNHGNVTRVQVHKGYCFVQFEKGTEAKAAIDKENGSMLLGKRIDVKTEIRYTNKQEQLSGTTVKFAPVTDTDNILIS